MAKFRIRKRTLKRLISAVLVTVLVASLGGALISVLSKDTKTIHPTFSVGGLDENGYYVEDNSTIYTKKAFECSGLRVQPDFESSVTYDIYLYDGSEKFIEAKKGLTKVFADDIGSAKYARIVIHPEIPEDTKEDEFQIKWYQISGYANQIKITVNKDQTDDINPEGKSYGPNLYDETKAVFDSRLEGYSGTLQIWDGEPDMSGGDKRSEKIIVDDSYDNVDVVFHYTKDVDRVWVYIVNGDNNLVLDSLYADFTDLKDGEYVTLSFDVSTFQTLYDDVCVYINASASTELFVFGY